MRTAELQYELPNELVARYPTAEREAARLLVVQRDGLAHRRASDLADLLPPGALLVVNDSRVIPARLIGRKPATFGRVEVLLVRRLEATGSDSTVDGAERWVAMARPSRRLTPGTRIEVGSELVVEIESRHAERGLWIVQLRAVGAAAVADAIDAVGRMPLPPYIGRDAEPLDRERYQTVYARVPGAVAAPTAGLHLSQALLDRLTARGVHRAAITLHVGPGTFRPVSATDLNDHPMHSEWFTVPASTVEAIGCARDRGSPVVAVGTTVVRALESAADPLRPGRVLEREAETRLLIQPGHRFAVVDGLLTNFHLPGSTLLALVYAFGGTCRVRAAYAEAVRCGYRFYSYGDAMYLPAPARVGADAEPRSPSDPEQLGARE